jgi:hypothetical protein
VTYRLHPVSHILLAGIAQSVEQRTRNAKVVGSIPITGTIKSIGYDYIEFANLKNVANLLHFEKNSGTHCRFSGNPKPQ